MKLYLGVPMLDNDCFVSSGTADGGVDCKVIWMFKDEYLGPIEDDVEYPEDLQDLCNWEHPDEVIIGHRSYDGEIEMEF